MFLCHTRSRLKQNYSHVGLHCNNCCILPHLDSRPSDRELSFVSLTRLVISQIPCHSEITDLRQEEPGMEWDVAGDQHMTNKLALPTKLHHDVPFTAIFIGSDLPDIMRLCLNIKTCWRHKDHENL